MGGQRIVKLLILGGTVFLGRHLVDAARTAGHEPTLFNRGQSAPGLFPDVEQLRGDRDGDLSALAGRRWDRAIDTCGYLPRVVRASAELLAGQVEHYTFISSVSVYAGATDESAAVAELDQPTEEITGASYGPLKALCETAVREATGGRALIVRPGLIGGPHDPSDRFTYWPARLARGRPVLAPGSPGAPVQLIDARDLAAWIVSMSAAAATGVYNAVGTGLTFATMLEACAPDAELVWVDEEFLLAAGVAPFTELPLWVPAESHDFFRIDGGKAFAAGLRCRPLAETARDTLAWDQTRPQGPRQAGLAPERESELLARWFEEGRKTRPYRG